jgi:hypothetical protein
MAQRARTHDLQDAKREHYPKATAKTNKQTKILFKDGVWSAFEHHCAQCYNLPFTGFILIPFGANLLRIYY